TAPRTQCYLMPRKNPWPQWKRCAVAEILRENGGAMMRTHRRTRCTSREGTSAWARDMDKPWAIVGTNHAAAASKSRFVDFFGHGYRLKDRLCDPFNDVPE